jgi:protoheme IX farnesyltransferase
MKLESLSIENNSINMVTFARACFLLTKPRIVFLFVVTGISSMILQGSLLGDVPNGILKFWVTVVAMFLVAGSANAYNQVIDRDIDTLMERTRKKRPIPLGHISPVAAFIFATVAGILGVGLLFYFTNRVAAFWGFFTIFYYVVVYTMWLKRSTPYNIVIGGAAGATAPLIGWAAGAGNTPWAPWILFSLIFLWTPPHFWALALCVKDEYAKASIPMLPVVKGEQVTRRQIWWYSLSLLPVSLSLLLVAKVSWVYGIGCTVVGLEFIRRAWRVNRDKNTKAYWWLFGYSIVYLFLVFVLLLVDLAVYRS